MEENYPDNPMQLFQSWFYHIKDNYPQVEANAMSLITTQPDNYPRCRVVLLKYYNWEGFTFFTNYTSDKAKAILHNQKVSLLFNWSIANREVHVYGIAQRVPEIISENYFQSRPRASQIGAWVSNQSEVISSRATLERIQDYYEAHFADKLVTRPDHWGGFIVKPQQIKFKLYSENALSECISYNLTENYDWEKSENFEING